MLKPRILSVMVEGQRFAPGVSVSYPGTTIRGDVVNILLLRSGESGRPHIKTYVEIAFVPWYMQSLYSIEELRCEMRYRGLEVERIEGYN